MMEVFVDTSFFIALVNKQDRYHSVAVDIAEQMFNENWVGHLTVPVLFEIGDGFSRIGRREVGIMLIAEITESNNYLISTLDNKILEKAITRYRTFKDKQWSLTDCYSFEFMNAKGLKKALIFDRHFVQAGFETLV